MGSSSWLMASISLLGIGLVIGLVVVPASGKGTFKRLSARSLDHLSGAPAMRYYMAHPELAPANLRSRFEAIRSINKTGYHSDATLAPPAGDRLNFDDTGLPQNEESVSICKGNTDWVLEGTNDYRGLLDPEQNLTGWHWSNDGGTDLANEGLLPPIELSDQTTRPSGGDPVDVCYSIGSPTLVAASMNYDPVDPFGTTSAIGLYSTSPETLNTCPGGTDPSCWPTRGPVAESAPNHFLDKVWMDAGDTGFGNNAWVTYTDFDNSRPCCYADIMAVFCGGGYPTECGAPIQIDDPVVDEDVQFSDVTIGPDKRTYFTYVQVIGEIEGTAQTFIVKSRVADVACMDISCFGPIHTVDTIDNPLAFGGFLQANDFRIATIPKLAVKTVDGEPRMFVVYDECNARVLDGTLCEMARVEMRYSDDDGVTWSNLFILSDTSVDQVDYFPSVVNDTHRQWLAVAYYSNRYDGGYQNAQNIEMVTVDGHTGAVIKRQQVTTDDLMPNEPEADPLLGGFFIGDYIQVAAHKGTAYIGYNMNIHRVQYLFTGDRVRQQDNFLTKIAE